MIAYQADAAFVNNPLMKAVRFVNNPLLKAVRADNRIGKLQTALEAIFADKRVILAMRHDLAPPDSEAMWNGRPSTPLVVTGKLAGVKRLMGWGYRTLEAELTGSVSWRWVCGIYSQKVPNFRTIQTREAKLSAQILHLINARVMRYAQAVGLTMGEQVRMDSSVTESDIHYPTDSGLLDDSARVLSRLFKRARKVVGVQLWDGEEKAWFRDRHRQARRLAREIAQHARKTEKPSLKAYAALLKIVELLLTQAQHVQHRLSDLPHPAAHRLHDTLADYVPLVGQVVAQTRQRVFLGLTVPATHKLVSLFEPHTAIIRRGKAKPKDTEFGHTVWLAEVEGGLISDYRLLHGNPPDAPFVMPTLKRHRQMFGRPPCACSGDRSLYSPRNESQAKALGVQRVSLPQPGAKSPRRKRFERQHWFRAAQRFRVGIEGRISQLRRARRLDRCLNHGLSGFERWIAWAVIANNLALIADHLAKRRKRPRLT
jgi:IS5 family transposase